MLDIYPFIIQTITKLRPLTARISRVDSNLGSQFRRAQTSLALNVAEGMYSRGRNRQKHYHIALGSAREALSGLEVAVALGYLPSLESHFEARFDFRMNRASRGWRIIGTLVKLADKP